MKWIYLLILSWALASNANPAKTNSKRGPASAAGPAASSPAPTGTAAESTTSSTTTPASTTPPTTSYLVSTPLDPLPLVHLSTNLVDFTQGKNNFSIDFFNFKRKFFANVQTYSSTDQETVEKNGNKLKLSVTRHSMAIGFSWYAHDISSPRNWVVSPTLVFGKVDDSLDSSSQAGIGIKGSGLFRIGDRGTAEAGLVIDTVHASKRNALLLGVGYLL